MLEKVEKVQMVEIEAPDLLYPFYLLYFFYHSFSPKFGKVNFYRFENINL